MIDAPDEEPATAILNQEIPAKRKKVRKGTRSCWECKRRKIRCIFASSEDDTCIGCQRRRAPCVSQDMPEDLSPARKGNRHLSERIARVEDVMKDFLAGKHVGATSQFEGEPRQDRQPSNFDVLNARPNESAHSSTRAPFTLAESLGESTPNSSHLTPDSQGVSDQTDIETRALHHLFAAFPAEEDAKILLKESSRPALYTDLVNTQPHSKLTHETLATPHPLAELSGTNTHPVILAKLMLIFAITLQSPCGEKVLGLSEPSNILMRRLMTAATTWVTTREEMHGTVESLVCIILEGVFKTNSGNLRQAWAVYRRAMTVAQMMGLHRSPMPPLKRIDPEFDAHPEFMWFRIVYMDRYLSLLLGLPQGTADKSMGALSVLQYEPPLGKFERRLTVIASRILERNESAFDTSEITTTQSIDSELLGVSKSMPASFWRPADFLELTPGSPDTLLETVRLAAQVYYYGLLIQLHLPYMMHGIGDNTEQRYSQITCVNASREIMTRFIAHRSFNPMSSCSRPVDFFALLAAMTLLLAHLDTHHHREATNFLAHQRLSDRAMLDQALERMDVISNVNGDATTDQSAKLIQRLLDIEADAAEGSSYTATSVRGNDDDVQEGMETDGEELRLHIPYLGVIKIARQGPISREPSLGNAASRPHQTSQVELLQRERTPASFNNAFAPPPQQSHMDEHQSLGHLHGMDQGSTFSGTMPALKRSNAHLQASGYNEQCMLQYPSSSQDDIALQPDVELPSVAAGVDDWALQGVDMAFFDSLMRGTSCGDVAELEQ
ncbi:C6 zinc finger domain protein [Lentithecium fluviatile CBS 122367]|uniref:C6 zinc finger domain protein n=1 Tax=Lentithecium fluviatile CBS 122367 TaxID=1168545 RepID=A0A6G1JJ14_9PLEO|nr:C6 zinc finger domain protein [Lentithecium fluviatile CBS 122367]